jgi:phage tail sheath gpL-like
MAISTAVGLERVSRIVGYKITKGNFSNVTPNLPQRIAILGEANTANQGTLNLTPVEITSAQEAGQLYGYGSPIYNMMRILRPVTGGGIGGIPTIVYPQAVAGGAVAAEREITPTGTATENGVHTVVINGREVVDGGRYDINIVTGDTPAVISSKITDAINNVLGAPVGATTNAAPDRSTLLSKWAGLTSEDLTVTMNTNGNTLGVTYAITSTATGAATPTVTAALILFGSDWNTIVVNPYSVTATLDELEVFNGIPDPTNPTGRFVGIIMKPFISLFGELSEDKNDYTAWSSARTTEVTNTICPAPGSDGWPMEAAANVALLFGRRAQDEPHLDINALSYPDMPIPADGNIGDFADYNNRDFLVKNGSSTVDLVASRYQMQDFVTTYHPVGEEPPQFRYCRNLMLDFNVRFGYYLLEQINVVDHTIADDDDVVSASNVIKPKQWKQVVDAYADDLANRALIAQAPFMQDSIIVGISATNPDRLETSFSYKRTGIARISSTTAEAGFNFGEV